MSYMKKTFTFPKVAYTSARRVNLPVIEMELRYKDEDYSKPELSICGELWNARHTDIVFGGQCLDHLAAFKSLRIDPLFKKLYRLWHLYHLNGCHCGTEKQEQALDEAREAGARLDCFEKSRKYLEKLGLLIDDGYEYGSAWLYREIPEDDLKEIMSLLD